MQMNSMALSHLNMKRWAFAFLLLSSMAFAGALHAQTVVVDGLNGGVFNNSVGGVSQAAPSFRTGATATSIREIALSFGWGPANVTLALHAADASGFPTGSALASQQVAALTGVNTYAAASLGPLATFNMSPNQNYALVVRDATASMHLQDDNAVSNAATFSNGFTRVGSGYSTSSTSGVTWVARSYTPQFRLTVGPAVAAAAPASIPTLSEWGVVGLSVALFGVAAIRSRRRS